MDTNIDYNSVDFVDSSHPFQNLPVTLPDSFFDRLIRDISSQEWIEFLRQETHAAEAIFEGFSTRVDKLARLIRHPQVEVRLRRFMQSQPGFLELVLELWGQSNLTIVAFLEMLGTDFVMDSRNELKNLMGPERFLASLFLLGYLEDPVILESIDERFWKRHVTADVVEILLPFRDVWRRLIEEEPQAEMLGAGFDRRVRTDRSRTSGVKKGEKRESRQLRREQEKRAKVEEKLGKAEAEASRLTEEIRNLRATNEELRDNLKVLEEEQEHRFQNALRRERSRWYGRYRDLGLDDPAVLEKEQEHLEDLLKTADRALKLQSEADREYGVVGEIGLQLIRLNGYLKEIERVYADSLVVHSEVKRAKQNLTQARDRLLQRPGIEKVLTRFPVLDPSNDWLTELRFLEPHPENLVILDQLQNVVTQLDGMDLFGGLSKLEKEIQHKKRQIQETLYARFQPGESGTSATRAANLDDLVRTGAGRKLDLYVDGYNILLKAYDTDRSQTGMSLTQVRQAFIEAVRRKRSLFRKIFLVFDGQDASRERFGNVEIIYSDKKRGSSADSIIIEALQRRRDKKSLLATADLEIIEKTESRLHGVIDPLHFYSFVFDLDSVLLRPIKGPGK